MARLTQWFSSSCIPCALGLQDRNICLWNPAKGILIKTYTGHGYEVRDAAVAQDNSKFASCGGDKQARSTVPELMLCWSAYSPLLQPLILHKHSRKVKSKS